MYDTIILSQGLVITYFCAPQEVKYTDGVTAHHLSQCSAFMLKAQESFQVQDNERGKNTSLEGEPQVHSVIELSFHYE